MKLQLIISGGQTGADKTALIVAKELGFQTGGWVPKGCRTDEGPDLSLTAEYGCIEHTSPGYPKRTEANVIASDGTVVFGQVESSGSKLTIKLCKDYHKPYLINPTADTLRAWLVAQNIQILNVAGNRARTNPGICAIVRTTLEGALAPQTGD